ncbi:MAG: FHA domain-containing protein [Polyangiales bacterium]
MVTRLDEEVTRRHVFQPKTSASRAEQVRVVVLGGTLAGEKYEINGELTFGRGVEADVRIDDSLVSRRHARIYQRRNGAYIIEDLQSRNGTQVNGTSIDKQMLSYGDRIQVGGCLLLFTHHDPIEAQVEHRRKLEAIGRLGTGVAHDFNNLLGAVSSSVDFLLGQSGDAKLSDREVAEALNDIRAAASAATEMTGRLLGFAKEKTAEHATVNLSKLCGRCARAGAAHLSSLGEI